MSCNNFSLISALKFWTFDFAASPPTKDFSLQPCFPVTETTEINYSSLQAFSTLALRTKCENVNQISLNETIISYSFYLNRQDSQMKILPGKLG